MKNGEISEIPLNRSKKFAKKIITKSEVNLEVFHFSYCEKVFSLKL
jgi:hypothetical protein